MFAPIRYCALFVFLLLLPCAGAAELRELAVSSASVPGNTEDAASTAAFVVDRIGVGRNYHAQKASPCAWDEIPKGSDANGHVNIARMRFGDRLELLAIMLDPASGEVKLASRAQALYRLQDIMFIWAASPGDLQYPENAPNDLVSRLAYDLEHPVQPRGVYHLVVKAWDKGTSAGSADKSIVSAASGQGGVMRILPLAAAALHENGCHASLKPADATITLEVQMGELSCSARATLSKADKTICRIERHGMTFLRLYDSLRALFLNLIEWQGSVADFFHPGYERFRLFAVDRIDNEPGAMESKRTIMLGRDQDGLVAFDHANGHALWTVPWGRESSAACRNAQIFFFSGRTLSRISSLNGKPEYSFNIGALNDFDRFDALGERYVVGSSDDMCLYEKDAVAWTNKFDQPLQAGPLLTEAGVVMCDAMGVLRCFSFSGAEQWKTELSAGVSGSLYYQAGLVFARDIKGAMFVVDEKGRLLWRAELGDVPAGSPWVVGDKVVVGAKSRKLFVFNKATGALIKEQSFPTWLLGFAVSGDKVFCAMRDRSLLILDLTSLETQKTLRFPFRLDSEFMPVTEFPMSRPQDENDLVDKTSGFLVTDEKGMMYLVPTKQK